MKTKHKKPINKKQKGPLSLYPLKPEKALSAFMKINVSKLKSTRNG